MKPVSLRQKEQLEQLRLQLDERHELKGMFYTNDQSLSS